MAIKFCVFSDGRRTLAKLGEKCIGNGIRKIEFIHDAGDDKNGHPQVNLTIDLEDFKYMDPESFYRSEMSSGDDYQVYLQSAASSSGDDATSSTNAMVIARHYTSPSSPVWKNLYELKYDGSLTSYGYVLSGNVMKNTLTTILTNGGLEVRIGDTWNSSGAMTNYSYIKFDGNGITTNTYFSLGGDTHLSYAYYQHDRYESIELGNDDCSIAVGGRYLYAMISYRTSGQTVIADTDYLMGGYQSNQLGTLHYQSSSSKRYKDFIDNESDADALKLLDLPIVRFKYKEGYLDHEDENYNRTMVGIFAEDVAAQFEDAVFHKGGYIENYTDRQRLVRLIKLAQIQHREIEQLKQAAS